MSQKPFIYESENSVYPTATKCFSNIEIKWKVEHNSFFLILPRQIPEP